MGRAAKWPTGITERQLKDGTRRFQLAFSFRGKAFRKLMPLEVTKPNAKYLERLRSSIYMEIANGTFRFGKYWPDSKEAQLYDTTSDTTRSIPELLAAYLEQCESRQTIEPNTLSTYRINVERILNPAFGHLRLCDLSARRIEEWIAESSQKTTSLQTYLIPLKAVCNRAHAHGDLVINPFDSVDYSRLLSKAERVAKRKEVIAPFTLDEIRLLVDAAYPWTKNAILFNAFTGLRTSELIALKWVDVDLKKRVAHIVRARDAEGRIKLPKSDKTRVIELRGPALQAIKDQRAATALRSEWVFLNRRGQPWTTYRKYREHWLKIIQRTGIEYRSPYQLRHTFASLMLSGGESIVWVAHMMGHKRISVVEENYHTWIPEVTGDFETKTDWDRTLFAHENKQEP